MCEPRQSCKASKRSWSNEHIFLCKRTDSRRLTEAPGNFPHASAVGRWPAAIKIFEKSVARWSPTNLWGLELWKSGKALWGIKRRSTTWWSPWARAVWRLQGAELLWKQTSCPLAIYSSSNQVISVGAASRHAVLYDKTTCKEVIFGIQQLHLNVSKLQVMWDWRCLFSLNVESQRSSLTFLRESPAEALNEKTGATSEGNNWSRCQMEINLAYKITVSKSVLILSDFFSLQRAQALWPKGDWLCSLCCRAMQPPTTFTSLLWMKKWTLNYLYWDLTCGLLTPGKTTNRKSP